MAKRLTEKKSDERPRSFSAYQYLREQLLYTSSLRVFMDFLYQPLQNLARSAF